MLFSPLKIFAKNVINYATKLPFTSSIIHKLNEAARGKCVVFFSLHRLLRENYGFTDHPHYLNQTALSAKQLCQILTHIKKTLMFISIEESLVFLQGHKPMLDSYAVLLIDVPYLQTLSLLKPILKNLNIPACVMLSTDMLHDQEMPWTDEVIYRFCETKNTELSLNFIDRTLLLYSKSERLASAQHAIENLSHANPAAFKLRLEQIRKALPDTSLRGVSERISSISQLINFGQSPLISFASAGKMRVPFFEMNEDCAEKEIYDAKLELSRHFDAKLKPVFYCPKVFDRHKDKRMIDTLLKAGFRAAIMDNPGVCRPGDNMFRLMRLPLTQMSNSFENFELQGLYNAIDEFLLISLAKEKEYRRK